MIDNIDKNIIDYLSSDIEVSIDLYEDLGEKLDISEDELIERIKKLQENECLKRIGPIMRHQKSGYNSNAMAVWNICSSEIEDALDIIKPIKNISHVYERKTYENWNYNLYTMIHGKSKEEVEKIINYLSRELNIKDYKVLYTIKEHKKTSPNLAKLIKNK